MQKFAWDTKTDVQAQVGDWNWRAKLLSTGGHLGFTFYLPVTIPDVEIEFTTLVSLKWTKRVHQDE